MGVARHHAVPQWPTRLLLDQSLFGHFDGLLAAPVDSRSFPHVWILADTPGLQLIRGVLLPSVLHTWFASGVVGSRRSRSVIVERQSCRRLVVKLVSLTPLFDFLIAGVVPTRRSHSRLGVDPTVNYVVQEVRPPRPPCT